MRFTPDLRRASGIASFIILSVFSPAGFALDAGAAETLARQNGCTACHSVDKVKVGPSFKAIAAKYRGNADAEATVIDHITSGDDDHKIINSKDLARQQNLVQWILSF
jgi:cytochrome c